MGYCHSVVILPFPCIAATSNTAIKFEAGPFNCSADLNIHCHDIIIGKPVHKEMTDRTDYYVNYPVEICGVSISFTRYNKSNSLMQKKALAHNPFLATLSLLALT